MKYNLSLFKKAVDYYEAAFKSVRNRSLLLIADCENEEAFFSLAPLSLAARNLRCDLAVHIIQQKSEALDALFDVWRTFEQIEQGVKTKQAKALQSFIEAVDKKAKGEFRQIFKKPEMIIFATRKGFCTSNDQIIEYRKDWFKRYRWEELIETARIIWRDVYNLKATERVGLGFDLLSRQQDMQYCLEDYLDHYAIARTMFIACPAKRKSMKTATVRKSMLENGERTSELFTTLLGCELEKKIDEPIFKKYQLVSRLLRLDRIKPGSASFFVKGEGYPGRHIFGEYIGYPTPNKKSRWDSPGGIIYQFPWSPQTSLDSRPPLARVAFTDTIPIDIYIESCKIDWMEMKRIDDKLISQAARSHRIIVEGEKTRLEIGLIREDGTRRQLFNSDVRTRDLFEKEALKKGILAGNMGNIPAGEMFLTPQYVKGVFCADVVISIDKSYVLNEKEPLIVKCNGKNYVIVSGPKRIVAKLNQKKREAMKLLLKQEKNKSLPHSIIDLKKENFDSIGEFAINTNPKARLCNYLIVNEKIAGMIHLALGSGFEQDRSTVYHYDAVINAKRQKLDIYGLAANGKKHWMMKKGKLLFGWS